jgi:DNA-directed RNA polymerase specialized sigma24 family protein
MGELARGSYLDVAAAYREHHADVRRRLRGSISASPELLDDAMANTWLIAWCWRDRLRARSLRAWLFTVARNEALALLERERRAVPVDNLEPPPYREHYHDLQDALEALAACKPDEIRALYGRALGLSYRELCEALGWTNTKVNRCISEGRVTARAALAA